jgi:hypothetical protein
MMRPSVVKRMQIIGAYRDVELSQPQEVTTNAAMEMRKEQDHEESIRILRELAYDPQAKYVAAFFMAAQQLAELDQIEQARALLRDGIEEARTQNNLHAAAEMSELLSDLGK